MKKFKLSDKAMDIIMGIVTIAMIFSFSAIIYVAMIPWGD